MTTNQDKERVDPRMKRTRKLLQDALFELLKQKPLAKIQIKEIAEVAGLSRPSFYKQFETKEQLFFTHVDDVFDQISQEVFTEAQSGKQMDMMTLLTAIFRQWQQHQQLLRWVFQVQNSELVMKALQSQAREIKKLFDQFLPPLELAQEYEEYVIGFLTGGMYMLLKRWLDNDMRESPERMAALTFMLLQNGFTPVSVGEVGELGRAIKLL